MPQSADEKRGYQRGYNRANSTAWNRVRRVIEVAKGYRARLVDNSNGSCAECRRWLRGAGQNNSSGCKWGSCRADFECGLEARMWVDLPLGTPRSIKPTITTSEEFGCVNWLPKTQP